MKSAHKSLGSLLFAVALVVSLAGAPQDDPRAEIVNLRKYTHPNFTRVVLDIGKLREYTFGELRDPGRIYIDVLQAKLNPILQGQSYPVKAEYVSQIRISQKTVSTVRLVVDVDFARDPVLPSLPPASIPSGWSSTSTLTAARLRPRRRRRPKSPPSPATRSGRP